MYHVHRFMWVQVETAHLGTCSSCRNWENTRKMCPVLKWVRRISSEKLYHGVRIWVAPLVHTQVSQVSPLYIFLRALQIPESYGFTTTTLKPTTTAEWSKPASSEHLRCKQVQNWNWIAPLVLYNVHERSRSSTMKELRRATTGALRNFP